MGDSKFMNNLQYKITQNSYINHIAPAIEKLHPNEKIRKYSYTTYNGLRICEIREDIIRELEIIYNIVWHQKYSIEYTFRFIKFEPCVVGQLASELLKYYNSFKMKYYYTTYLIKDENRDIDIFVSQCPAELMVMLYQLPIEIKTLFYTEWEIANL